MNSPLDQLQSAEAIARRLHADQVDKSGAPYTGHCERVASKLTQPTAKTVAWLHDVLEDTSLGEAALRSEFDPAVVDAVVALTRIDCESPDVYYARVRANELAKSVKLADIHDNLDPVRLAKLESAERDRFANKYGKALVALFGDSGEA
jgi:(p)ppGpp synthase/HD superfamily hydrolase